ncbi:MAG: glycosyltransferase family 39 protein [Victivallaceae bacterium]|nr:glycosyltransferase family 39 protein [Victivallaceae bacterium]
MAVVLGGVGIRVLRLLLLSMPSRDGSFYVFCVNAWNAGGTDEIMRLSQDLFPAFPFRSPLFLYLVHLLTCGGTLPVYWCGIVVNMIFSAVVAVPVFMIVRRLVPGRVFPAWVAAVLVEFHPFAVEIGTSFLREPVALFFCAMSMAMAVDQMYDDSPRCGALAGIFGALACLARFEMAEVLLVDALVLAMAWRPLRLRTLPRVCLAVTSLAGCFVATWCVMVFTMFGVSGISAVMGSFATYFSVFAGGAR